MSYIPSLQAEAQYRRESAARSYVARRAAEGRGRPRLGLILRRSDGSVSAPRSNRSVASARSAF
jgi:hypothetical protein